MTKNKIKFNLIFSLNKNYIKLKKNFKNFVKKYKFLLIKIS